MQIITPSPATLPASMIAFAGNFSISDEHRSGSGTKVREGLASFGLVKAMHLVTQRIAGPTMLPCWFHLAWALAAACVIGFPLHSRAQTQQRYTVTMQQEVPMR